MRNGLYGSLATAAGFVVVCVNLNISVEPGSAASDLSMREPAQTAGSHTEKILKTLAWAPSYLRSPSVSANLGTLKFAFFAEKRRLLVEKDGALQLFDSGRHQIFEVCELGVDKQALAFSSQEGSHLIEDLRRIN